MKDPEKSTSYFLHDYDELRVWIKYELGHYEKRIIQLVNVGCNELILDNGSGNGRFSLAMAGAGANIISIDVSRRMIREVNKRRHEQGFDGKISPVVADAQNLPFKNGVFDKTLCVHNLWYYPKLEQAVREMLRTAKIDAKIVVDHINFLNPIFLIGKAVCIRHVSRPKTFNEIYRTPKGILKPFRHLSYSVFSIVPCSLIFYPAYFSYLISRIFKLEESKMNPFRKFFISQWKAGLKYFAIRLVVRVELNQDSLRSYWLGESWIQGSPS